jgi:hypothetical protein
MDNCLLAMHLLLSTVSNPKGHDLTQSLFGIKSQLGAHEPQFCVQGWQEMAPEILTDANPSEQNLAQYPNST